MQKAILFFLSAAVVLGFQERDGRIELTTYLEKTTGTKVLVGTCRVFEDRDLGEGRTIDLNLMVLPALDEASETDPIFWLHGGPGVAATNSFRGMAASWMRRKRDIVLVDQRGTGKSNPLHVDLPVSELQDYLDPIFRPEPFRASLARLEKRADLTKYTTPMAMDDLNEVREALGYGKINLIGGSYGTRAALVYLRRHPETVRCAVLNGVAPISFINPLYHASAAQEGLEKLFEEIEAEPEYRKAFPSLRKKFNALLLRLEAEPVKTVVVHPDTGEAVTVELSRTAFTEALRIMMYYMDTNRRVPLLLLRAYEGDFAPFAQLGVTSNRRIRGLIHFGMLMCVTGSEDIPRIEAEMIPALTENTFLGDGRVRRQMAVAGLWPRGEVPRSYGEPVRSDVPVLLFSGTHDPVTPPRFGAAAAKHLSNSLHLVVPAAHGAGGAVVDAVIRDFLGSGTVKGLDTSGIGKLELPRLELP